MYLWHSTYLLSAISVVNGGFAGHQHGALGVEPGANFFGPDQTLAIEDMQDIPQECTLFFEWHGQILMRPDRRDLREPRPNLLYDFGPERKHLYLSNNNELKLLFVMIRHRQIDNDIFSDRRIKWPGRRLQSLDDCVTFFGEANGKQIPVG